MKLLSLIICLNALPFFMAFDALIHSNQKMLSESAVLSLVITAATTICYIISERS